MATAHRSSGRSMAEAEIAIAALVGCAPIELRGWVIVAMDDEHGVQMMGCCTESHSIALMAAATGIAAEHIHDTRES